MWALGCENHNASSFQLGAPFGQAVDPFKPAEEIVFGILQGLAGPVDKSKAE